MGESEYLRIDDDSHPAPFIYVAGGVGIVTGTCALPDGTYEEFYDNGQLSIRTGRRNGVQFGPWESYYENGQLGRKGTLNEDGSWTGSYEEYDEDGQLIARGQYESSANGAPPRCGEWYMRLHKVGATYIPPSAHLSTAQAIDTLRSVVIYPPCR